MLENMQASARMQSTRKLRATRPVQPSSGLRARMGVQPTPELRATTIMAPRCTLRISRDGEIPRPGSQTKEACNACRED